MVELSFSPFQWLFSNFLQQTHITFINLFIKVTYGHMQKSIIMNLISLNRPYSLPWSPVHPMISHSAGTSASQAVWPWPPGCWQKPSVEAHMGLPLFPLDPGPCPSSTLFRARHTCPLPPRTWGSRGQARSASPGGLRPFPLGCSGCPKKESGSQSHQKCPTPMAWM